MPIFKAHQSSARDQSVPRMSVLAERYENDPEDNLVAIRVAVGTSAQEGVERGWLIPPPRE